MPMGLNKSPAICQSYINKILDCLQSRKYGDAIMDDLLLFTLIKKTHMEKVMDRKYLPQKVSFLERTAT